MFDRLFRRSASVPALCVNQPAIDDDAAERLHDAERRIAQLELLLQQSVIELDQYRTLATAKAPKVSRKAALTKAPKPEKLGALEFWSLHGQAVDKIRALYGDNWKVSAPFGETELVTLAPCYRKAKTERGTVLSWSRDQRVPSAGYWPNGMFPDGVTACGDYDRADLAEARKVFQLRAKGKPVPVATHDDAWHIANGYALHNGEWIAEILLRSQLAHEEGIELEREARRIQALERACLTYGPQPLATEPFTDIADDLAEAAD